MFAPAMRWYRVLVPGSGRARRIPRPGLAFARAAGVAVLVALAACESDPIAAPPEVVLEPVSSVFAVGASIRFTLTNGTDLVVAIRSCTGGWLERLDDGGWQRVVRPDTECLLIGPTLVQPGQTSGAFGVPYERIEAGTHRGLVDVWLGESGTERRVTSASFEVR